MRRLPRLAGLLALCLLAASIIVGTGGAAQAEITPPSGGGWAELFNPLLPLVDGKYHVCLDVPGGTTQDRYPLQMYHCHGYASNGAPQRWEFHVNWNGTYNIINQSNLLCVTVLGSGFTSDHGIIEQRSCGDASGGQDWRLIDFQPGQSFQLQAANRPDIDGMCIASGANHNNGRMFWEPCASDAFQIFALG
jgi:hypothetical protein